MRFMSPMSPIRPIHAALSDFLEENKMAHRRYKWVTAPIAAVLIFCLAAGAQVAQVEKVDLDMMKKIREEGMQRSQVMETLSWLTDVHGPRLTNSPQYNRACGWAKGRLIEWGLRNATLGAWGAFCSGWPLEDFTANIVKPDFIPLIAYPKAPPPPRIGGAAMGDRSPATRPRCQRLLTLPSTAAPGRGRPTRR